MKTIKMLVMVAAIAAAACKDDRRSGNDESRRGEAGRDADRRADRPHGVIG